MFRQRRDGEQDARKPSSQAREAPPGRILGHSARSFAEVLFRAAAKAMVH